MRSKLIYFLALYTIVAPSFGETSGWLRLGNIIDLDEVAEFEMAFSSDGNRVAVMGSSAEEDNQLSVYNYYDPAIYSFNSQNNPSWEPNADADGDGLLNIYEWTNSVFTLVTNRHSWISAREDAISRGGHLATISHYADWEIVKATAYAAVDVPRVHGYIAEDGVWLGATDADLENTWRWVINEPVSFTAWATNTPNGGSTENYLEIGAEAKYQPWDDADEWWELTYVLEQNDSNWILADTDGDGLSDGYEKTNSFTRTDLADTDGDGILDPVEINTYGTDPNDYDTDGDGLSDGQEIITFNTDPLMDTDADDDGLSDYVEAVLHQTDPNNKDSDGDGISDYYEVTGAGSYFIANNMSWSNANTYAESLGAELALIKTEAQFKAITNFLSTVNAPAGNSFVWIGGYATNGQYFWNDGSPVLPRFELVEGSFTWQAAQDDAISRGGHLATITSPEEQSQIENAANISQGLWLGGTDQNSEGIWEWVTGETWTIDFWNDNEPSNAGGSGPEHYLMTLGDGWNDTTDNANGTTSGYILERSNQHLLYWGLPSYTSHSSNGHLTLTVSDITNDQVDLYTIVADTDDHNRSALMYMPGIVTDPNSVDTDGDGLSDYAEINGYGTDPNNPDTDGDNLSDGDEIASNDLNNTTYQPISGSYTWYQAKWDAHQRGGHLATITSEDEFNIIAGLNPGDKFLGATDEFNESDWIWVTFSQTPSGTNDVFNDLGKWALGQPDNSGDGQNYLRLTDDSPPYNYQIDDCDNHETFVSGYILEIPDQNPMIYDVQVYQLTINLSGNGQVSPESGSTYISNSTVVVSATPDSGSLFMGWSGDLNLGYEASTLSIIIQSNMNITAEFSNDADNDLLTNNEEALIGTNPRSADTDGDGLNDNIEVTMTNMTFSFDPNSHSRSELERLQAALNAIPGMMDDQMMEYRSGNTMISIEGGDVILRLPLEASTNSGMSWYATTNIIEISRPATNNTEFFDLEFQ